MDPKNVVLVGFMGTGKTSVGKVLARKLDRQVFDVDRLVELDQGRKISDIFEREGEAFFRSLEKQMIREVSQKRGVVITTGGGAVLDPENMEHLKKTGWVVRLSARPETIFARVRRSRHRPLLKGKDQLTEIRRLLEFREPFYQKADLTFETDGQNSSEVAHRILEALKGKLS